LAPPWRRPRGVVLRDPPPGADTLKHPGGPHNWGFGSIPTKGVKVVQVGCGGVGQVIARHLAHSAAVREIVLADLDAPLAQRVAAGLPGGRARGLGLDASDAAAVSSLLQGAQVLVNATLPIFNTTLMTAAREQSVAYLDMASASSDPFIDDAKWKAAGVPAIIGMGEDPGLSNVLARHGADQMDSVDAIRIRDGDTASSPEYPFICLFSPETFIGETLNSSRIWQNGAYMAVPPFGGFERYDFPAPVGPQPVYEVDHEEVDTLPRYIGKGVRYVDFKLALDDRTVRVLKTFQDLQIFDANRPDRAAARKAILSVIPKPGELTGKLDGSAALVVEVDGRKDGAPHRVRYLVQISHPEAARKYGATGTSYLTGTGGAIGALMLATGQVSEPGMHSPETLDPAPFITALSQYGVPVREEVLSAKKGPARRRPTARRK
jgi:saccharopine dehydrogenase (NAD+, L-lysine forming)